MVAEAVAAVWEAPPAYYGARRATGRADRASPLSVAAAAMAVAHAPDLDALQAELPLWTSPWPVPWSPRSQSSVTHCSPPGRMC